MNDQLRLVQEAHAEIRATAALVLRLQGKAPVAMIRGVESVIPELAGIADGVTAIGGALSTAAIADARAAVAGLRAARLAFERKNLL